MPALSTAHELVMNVYEINTLVKPPRGNFPNYASLTTEPAKFRRLGYDPFSGVPFPRRWEPLELYLEQPKYPQPDFFSFGSTVFVCSDRVRDLVGEALADDGEFLPVSIEGNSTPHFIYNITSCPPVFDSEKSLWTYFGPKNAYKDLVMPAFRAERFGEESVFKFADVGAGTMYCLERTGDAEDGEFKALVERERLTGIDFKLVWDSETGPVIPPPRVPMNR